MRDFSSCLLLLYLLGAGGVGKYSKKGSRDGKKKAANYCNMKTNNQKKDKHVYKQKYSTWCYTNTKIAPSVTGAEERRNMNEKSDSWVAFVFEKQ